MLTAGSRVEKIPPKSEEYHTMTLLLTNNLTERTEFFQNSNLQHAAIDHTRLHMSTVNG